MSLGDKKKQETTYASTTKVKLPSWVEGPLRDLISRGESLSEQPFNPYTDQRIAGFSPDELQAFGLTRDLIGQYNVDPSIDIANEVARRGLEGFTQQELQPYMNPYIENVLDISRRRQFENYDRSARDLRSRAAEAGAFGGSRFGLAEAQLNEDFQEQIADFDTQGLYNAYNEGMGRAMQGTQLAGQAGMDMANLVKANRGLAGQDIQALLGIGGQQRALEQAGLDFDFSEFQREQAFPYEQLEFLAGLGLPLGQLTAGSTTSSRQTNTTSGGSGMLGTALGIGSMALGIPGVGSAAIGGLGNMFGQSFAGGLGNMMGITSSISGGAYGFGQTPIGPNEVINWRNHRRLNRGGPVESKGLQNYNRGGVVSGNVSRFLKDFLGGSETEEGYSKVPDEFFNSYPLDDYPYLYPGGPTREEMRETWERQPAPNVTVDPNYKDDDATPLPNWWDKLEKKYKLPTGVLEAKRFVESSGGKNLVSPVGAEGPFQLMPITQKHLGVNDPYDEYESAEAAARLMREYLDMFDNDFDKAMAAYNWGPGNVKRRGMDRMPKETRNHLKKLKKQMGINRYNRGGAITPFGQPNMFGGSDDLYRTPFESFINRNIRQPLQTGVENLERKGLDAARGLERIGQFFTQSEEEFNRAAPTQLDKMREDKDLERALNRLYRGQLPINLQKKMNQVGSLVDTGATDVRLGPEGNLFVHDYKTAPVPKRKPTIPSPLATQQVAEQVKKVTGNEELFSPITKSKSGKQQREDDGWNTPLIEFGAALLTSENDFFTALGEGARAFSSTKRGEEQLARQMQREDLQDQLQSLRVGAELQRLNDPTNQLKNQLELEKLRQELAGIEDLQERIDRYSLELIKAGTHEVDDIPALASRLALTDQIANNAQKGQTPNQPISYKNYTGGE